MNIRWKLKIVLIIFLSILVIILVNRLFKKPPTLKQVEIIREIKLPEEPREIEELELPQEERIAEEKVERPKEKIPEANLEEIPFETLPAVRPEEMEKEVEKSKEPTEERLKTLPSPEELRKIKEKSLIIY
jgi:hypothetical protein